jgi:hypothetical protein
MSPPLQVDDVHGDREAHHKWGGLQPCKEGRDAGYADDGAHLVGYIYSSHFVDIWYVCTCEIPLNYKQNSL